MEKTDKTVSTIADKLGDKALQYLNALEEVTKQYAPDVIDAALMVVRFDSLATVVQATLLLLLSVWAFNYLGKPFMREYKKGILQQNDGVLFPTAIGCIFALGIGGVQVVRLASVWTWIGIFEPKLYLAYKIFGKLL